MKSHLVQIKRAVKLVSGAGLVLGSLIAFQNCSGGFQRLQGAASLASISSSAPDGAKLYAQNCAACHSSLETSEKRNRTAGQIKAATLSVPQMINLSVLSQDEIDLIAKALEGAPPTASAPKYFQCVAGDPGLSVKSARRLSKYELVNSLEDLFGASEVQRASFSTKLALLRTDPLGDVDSFDNKVEDLDTLLAAFEELTGTVFANTTLLNSIMSTCGTSISTTCKSSFITFAEKALRRPLNTTERAEHIAFIDENGTTKEALRYAVIRILLSPMFHQHLEVDESQIIDGKVKLNQFEIASRISYRLTGFPPDLALRTAASSGGLSSLAQIQTQSERLAVSARGKAHFQRFLEHWLLRSKGVDPNSIIQSEYGISPVGFGAEATEEFRRFADHVVYNKQADFKTFYTDSTVFPYTDRLSKVLATPQSASPVVGNGSHSGILLRPLMTLQSSKHTNLINRGLILRRRILCGDIPRPNLAVINERGASLADYPHQTYSNRTIVTEITKSQSCQSCHSQINALGFVMEAYNPFGGLRVKENVYDANNEIIAQHDVDTRVSDLNIPDESAIPATSPSEMVQAISQSDTAMRCMSQHLFRYSQVRAPSTNDGCTLNTVSDSLRQGKSVKDALILNTANEEVFWRSLPVKDGI